MIVLQILSIFEAKNFANHERLVIPKALEEILDDIQKNFATIHNINSILSSHYVSSTTLNRWFRQYIHSSPREYLESVRLSNALNMLLDGATVTEACLNCGFSDCSHFIILFKKKFGLTPKKYIKSLNK
jgi:AraC-like DNA-binding protein